MLVTMLAAIVEFERKLNRARAGEGRTRVMGNGVGRKPKLSDFQREEGLARRRAGETLAAIAKGYAVSVSMNRRL